MGGTVQKMGSICSLENCEHMETIQGITLASKVKKCGLNPMGMDLQVVDLHPLHTITENSGLDNKLGEKCIS